MSRSIHPELQQFTLIYKSIISLKAMFPLARDLFEGSLAEFVNFSFDASNSAGKGHVHEFRLSVHLEASHDGLINFVLNSELFAGVLWVGLQGSDDLVPLIG